ncbi:MAG: hypothetical protein L0Y50_13410, partial [Beijerinckiaceae bacterium]|nr:hypothetical protein [Beijerinckiaceae bacterium]
GKSRSMIKGTRVHDLRSRSIIYRLPSTILGKPTLPAKAGASGHLKQESERSCLTGKAFLLTKSFGPPGHGSLSRREIIDALRSNARDNGRA